MIVPIYRDDKMQQHLSQASACMQLSASSYLGLFFWPACAGRLSRRLVRRSGSGGGLVRRSGSVGGSLGVGGGKIPVDFFFISVGEQSVYIP